MKADLPIKPFPVQITLKIDNLNSGDETQTSKAQAIYPDGWGFSGSVVVLRKNGELKITFVGECL